MRIIANPPRTVTVAQQSIAPADCRRAEHSGPELVQKNEHMAERGSEIEITPSGDGDDHVGHLFHDRRAVLLSRR